MIYARLAADVSFVDDSVPLVILIFFTGSHYNPDRTYTHEI